MAEVVDLCIVTVPARRGVLIDWIDRPLAWDMLGQSKLGDVSMWPNRKLIDLLGIDLPIIISRSHCRRASNSTLGEGISRIAGTTPPVTFQAVSSGCAVSHVRRSGDMIMESGPKGARVAAISVACQ